LPAPDCNVAAPEAGVDCVVLYVRATNFSPQPVLCAYLTISAFVTLELVPVFTVWKHAPVHSFAQLP
jgi:hypothetical protein